MKETDLARTVVNWLTSQHWDVYQEVPFRGASVADIAAVRSGYLWIIECKTSLTFKVLEQAHRWPAHFRSIAVPQIRDRSERQLAYSIAKNYLNLGIIEYKCFYSDSVTEVYAPPLMRQYHKEAKQLIKRLMPEHKTALAAGSNGGGYYTPYRSTMDKVKRFISSHPGCTLKEIMQDLDGKFHYSTSASAKSGIRTALSNWESAWCEVRFDGKELRYFLKQ